MISDNGASGEGGPNGSAERGQSSSTATSTRSRTACASRRVGRSVHLQPLSDRLAMAFNTPCKLYKRYAPMRGHSPTPQSSPGPTGLRRTARSGTLRQRLRHHPTVYELLGIAAPETVRGVAQKPLEGVSFKAALDDPGADPERTPSSTPCWVTRGIWHDGWFANTVHPAAPSGWSPLRPGPLGAHDIANDRSQCHDVAAEHPDKLTELQALWFTGLAEITAAGRPQRLRDGRALAAVGVGDRNRFVYPHRAGLDGCVRDDRRALLLPCWPRSISTARAPRASCSNGGAGHGGVLFVADGRLQSSTTSSANPNSGWSHPTLTGRQVSRRRLAPHGRRRGHAHPVGDATDHDDGTEAGHPHKGQGPPIHVRAGRRRRQRGPNLGQPVSTRVAPFEFNGGTIHRVVVDVSGTVPRRRTRDGGGLRPGLNPKPISAELGAGRSDKLRWRRFVASRTARAPTSYDVRDEVDDVPECDGDRWHPRDARGRGRRSPSASTAVYAPAPDAPAPGSPSTDAATTVIPWADLGTDNRLSFTATRHDLTERFRSQRLGAGGAEYHTRPAVQSAIRCHQRHRLPTHQQGGAAAGRPRPAGDSASRHLRIVDKTVDLTLTLSAVPDDGTAWTRRARWTSSTVRSPSPEPMFPGDRRRLPAADPAQGDHRRARGTPRRRRPTPRSPWPPNWRDVSPAFPAPRRWWWRHWPVTRRRSTRRRSRWACLSSLRRPDNGLSLVGSGGIPQLRISGPADKLKNAARLLTNGALNLAVSTNVVTGDLRSDPRFPATPPRWPRSVDASSPHRRGGAAVTIYLDQTKFGHSIQGVRVHVQGSYTPVPSAFGGQVTVSIAGEPLESWPAEPSGVIDRWIAVPDRLVGRSIALTVAVNTTGNEGRCNEFRPVVLTVLGSSVVETTPANPPIPSGFRSLPQALMPQVQVGIGQNSFPDLARAIQIVTGLQRITDIPLTTQVTSVSRRSTAAHRRSSSAPTAGTKVHHPSSAPATGPSRSPVPGMIEGGPDPRPGCAVRLVADSVRRTTLTAGRHLHRVPGAAR